MVAGAEIRSGLVISQPSFAYTPRPMRRIPTALALLAALLLAPAAGRANSVPAPAAPLDGVRVGDVVVTPVPPLPPGAHEFELLLVPETGRPVQVGPETRAGAREVRWRVPHLSARRARLVLRAGGEGAEWESPASAWFDVATVTSALPIWQSLLDSPSAVSFETMSRDDSGFAPDPATPSLSAGASRPNAMPPPGSPALTPPADAHAHEVGSRSESATARGRRIMRRAPTTIPLRN